MVVDGDGVGCVPCTVYRVACSPSVEIDAAPELECTGTRISLLTLRPVLTSLFPSPLCFYCTLLALNNVPHIMLSALLLLPYVTIPQLLLYSTLISYQVRTLQATVETINTDVGSKRKAAALDGVKKTRSLLNDKNSKAITKSCRSPAKCEEIIANMVLDPLEASLKESMDAFNGSEQERTALDKAYTSQKILADQVGQLEEQMVPAGYKAFVPEEYSDMAQLQGRATVEMTFKKADGAPFDVNGVNFPTAKMTMVIDGYVCEYFYYGIDCYTVYFRDWKGPR
jgi:hypothetical protein